jgi:hypothetical protein
VAPNAQASPGYKDVAPFFLNEFSLHGLLTDVNQPRFDQFFKKIGIRSDHDLKELARWREEDRTEWFLRFRELTPYLKQYLQVTFAQVAVMPYPDRIDLMAFHERMRDLGLSEFLSQTVGVKTENDIRHVCRWDPSDRDPFFYRFFLTGRISSFQLEILRQAFDTVQV